MSHTAEYAEKTIYLDHAAATPTDPRVLESMLEYFGAEYGNASSMHSSGRRAAQALSLARAEVADIIGASPGEIIFTGSGTESDNLAIVGVARANKSHGDHIIISAIEHKAVIEPARRLEKEGFRVSVVPVDRFGMIDVSACVDMMNDKTILVSIMYANNEIGTIQPISALATAIKVWRVEHGRGRFPFFHTDACQAAGALSLDVESLGVDLMSLNGSKIYGPKGIGMLYQKTGVSLDPLILGGEQERALRAGTESVPLIVGFARALRLVEGSRESESSRLSALRDGFIARLLEHIPGAILNGHPTIRLPNNIHISIPHIEGESILLMLDQLGIEASTGSACSAYDLKPSHVLLALGQNTDLVHGSIRFSLGKATTREELGRVISVFPGIVSRLSAISILTASEFLQKKVTPRT